MNQRHLTQTLLLSPGFPWLGMPSRVKVDSVIKFDCMQLPILRANWHQLIRSLNIHFRQPRPSPQPHYCPCYHLYWDIFQEAEAGIYAVIDAGTFQLGKGPLSAATFRCNVP